jgi:hypothetical protein
MPKIRQKINRKKDCFLEYKIIDFDIILRDSPNMFNNKKESRNMTKYNNDPFGFNKAINFDKLDDPKILSELSKIFGIKEKTEEPNISYKKAVNNLKSKVRFK